MPLETRKQARERTGKFPEAIGDDREAEGREAGKISAPHTARFATRENDASNLPR